MTALHSRSLASRDDLRGCTKWTIERSTITRKYAGCSTTQPARCVPHRRADRGRDGRPESHPGRAAHVRFRAHRLQAHPGPADRQGDVLGRDARGRAGRAARRRPSPAPGWPGADADYLYLQQRLYASDPWPIYALTHRVANRTGWLKPLVDGLSSRLMTLLHRCAPIHSSALAQLVNEAPDAHERRRAVTLYRRTARSMHHGRLPGDERAVAGIRPRRARTAARLHHRNAAADAARLDVPPQRLPGIHRCRRAHPRDRRRAGHSADHAARSPPLARRRRL